MQHAMNTDLNTENNTENNNDVFLRRNHMKMPLPRGYIKLLAQKLNCHVNSIRKGWERLDPVWVKHINDFSKQIKKERTQALIDAGFPANYAKKLVKKGL
jgi:hypothetical protein